MADSKGGRSVSGNDHFEGIETPFKTHKEGEAPHPNSHPEAYKKHQDHVRENFHGK